jgi:CheY-like chemotaxis protein
VQCVGDGAAAVHAVREQRHDLVLMDVSMPVMNGIDATIAIRALASAEAVEDRYFSALSIIGVSAHAMPGDEEACLAAGMDDYLTKPVQRDALLAKMASMLSRSARVRLTPFSP